MQVLHQWWQRPMPPPSAPAAAAAAAAAAVTSAAATPAAATAAAPSGAAVDADRAVAGPLITASSSSRSSSTQDLQQQAGQELQGLPPSSSGSTSPDGGGQAAVSAVVNVLALPFRRESAKQQLRRELQGESCATLYCTVCDCAPWRVRNVGNVMKRDHLPASLPSRHSRRCPDSASLCAVCLLPQLRSAAPRHRMRQP
jgi:hypothetical protein